MFEQYKVIETLKVIKQIESDNCQNTKHKSDAMGCYGLRPIALKQIGIKKPHISYSELIQTLYATKYANHILSYTDKPNVEFLLYGWLNGPSAAKRRQKLFNYGIIPYRSPFSDHWYIKRYNKLTVDKLQFNL